MICHFAPFSHSSSVSCFFLQPRKNLQAVLLVEIELEINSDCFTEYLCELEQVV